MSDQTPESSSPKIAGLTPSVVKQRTGTGTVLMRMSALAVLCTALHEPCEPPTQCTPKPAKNPALPAAPERPDQPSIAGPLNVRIHKGAQPFIQIDAYEKTFRTDQWLPSSTAIEAADEQEGLRVLGKATVKLLGTEQTLEMMVTISEETKQQILTLLLQGECTVEIPYEISVPKEEVEPGMFAALKEKLAEGKSIALTKAIREIFPNPVVVTFIEIPGKTIPEGTIAALKE